MSKLYRRSDSSYYWWTAYYNGRRLRQSTKLTTKSSAKLIQLKWDMCLLEGDTSFYKIKDHLDNQVDQYFKDYLSFLKHRKSDNTIAIAKGVLNKFFTFLSDLNITELKDITTLVLNQYIDNMDAAPKTKKNHIGVLSLMFKQAQINGFLKSNPTEHVTLPKIVKTERHRLLDNEDLDIIFKYSDKWYLYYKFLLFTGLRAGDVAMLRYEDIDLSQGSITTLIRKSDRTHQIPLSNTLIDDIKDKMVFNSPIFPSLYTENNRKRNDNLARPRLHMQKALRQHNRPKATLHSFRVTFNCILRDKGLNIEDRRQLLAHSSSETTRIYTHPNFDLAKDYINQIPEFGKCYPKT